MADFTQLEPILDSGDATIYDVATHAPGAAGQLDMSGELLATAPSGDIFGLIQDVGMGWAPHAVGQKKFLILSTQGGLAAPDGTPVALGYHSGHWELNLLVEATARQLRALDCMPVAGFCSDPCDGRTQGTYGMMDSLAYRNDAAQIFRRLIRSLPTRSGVVGVATCDKGLPAMMMALTAMHDLPCVLVPGGVTLPPTHGEDLGTVQSMGARYAQGEVTLDYAREMCCRACASPGGGCQFLGTAATSQVVGEALGLCVPHAALAPSGQPIWLDTARRSVRAACRLEARGITMKTIVTDAAVRNAMTVFAAVGGSTNLLLHIPAICHAAGLRRPSVEDWIEVNRTVPRLVDVLPNGPVGHPTVRVFLAGGVPEVMLHLKRLELLELDALTVTGETLSAVLTWWEHSQRRQRLRTLLQEQDGVNPDDVIMSPQRARDRGLTSTVAFPRGNLAPQGSVVKSTAIDPSMVDPDGVYRAVGPARVFVSERDAFRAVKAGEIKAGDILVLTCAGPLGSGMEETLQVTGALKHLPWGKQVAVVTDARFSGVSTGACIGHVGPEALAGGPIGKVLDGDLIRIVIDRNCLEGRVDLIGEAGCASEEQSTERGTRLLSERAHRPDLTPHSDLPDDTRLWAALQEVGGGTWGGCVFDVAAIIAALKAGKGLQRKEASG